MNRSQQSQETINERLSRIADELLAGGITLEQAMQAFERKYIDLALSRSGRRVARAAQLLGVHRNTLHAKLRARIGR